LRFSPAETADYLELALKLRLSPADLETLVTRSEGWIAGLQMAAASLHQRDDVASFMQSLTGSQRNILDYLLQEVLQRLPVGTQDFLVQTSFLERLCGSLCDAVLDHPGSGQPMLESLERANLFTIPLDDQRTWYRYHHLFADLLQTRLYQCLDAAGLNVLRLRACQWYQEHALLPEAIELALCAGDFERAATLVGQAADDTLRRGELITFRHWLERLPPGTLSTHPSLCLYQAWALLWAGSSFETILACLEPLKQTDTQLPGLLPIQAVLALYQGEIDDAVQYARLALQRLPPDESFMRAMATMTLGSAAQMLNQDDRGWQLHDQAIQEGLASGNLLLSITMLTSLANQLQKEGRLGLAEEKYQQALGLARDAQGHYLSVATRPLVGLAGIAIERNQLSGIEAQLLLAAQLSQSWGSMALLFACLTLARAQVCLGKLQAAQENIDKARRQARQFDLTELDDLSVEISQARLWWVQADLESIYAWAVRRGLWEIDPQEGLQTSDFSNLRMRKYEYAVLARLYLARGKPQQALAVLDALIPYTQAVLRPALAIEALCLRSLVLNTLGWHQEAFGSLGQALQLAEPEGFVRLFLDEGPPLQVLIEQVLPRLNTARLLGFARLLLHAFSPVDAAKPAAAAVLAEPLSNRELEVLHLLVETSLSAEQIAERLYVSVHTVRSHIKSIYGKLGVHGRMEAASRARELNLA
jgi:LuxR family maltose regulon positive regulatory protein